MLGYLDQAIADFDHALWTGQGVVSACQTLGNILQALGRFDESVDWHARATQTSGNRAELFSGLGTLYAQQQRWDEAIAAYRQTLKLQPTHAETCWNLANIYALLNQPVEALEYRHRALKQSPHWATCQSHFSLGNDLMANHQIEAAIAAYHRALNLEASFAPAHYNLAVIFSNQKNYEAAIASYHRVLELEPDRIEAYLGLGQALEQQNQWQEALTWYRQAIELAPESVAAHYALGQLLLCQELWNESLVIYRRLIELQPADFKAYFHLGFALLNQRQYAQATAAFRHAIDRAPTQPEPYYYLTRALFEQRQWMEVISTALHVIRQQPNCSDIYRLLGHAIQQQSRQPRGLHKLIAHYRQSPLSSEHGLTFYLDVGDRLLNQRQFNGAILFYRLAVWHQPENEIAATNLKRAFAKRKQLEKTIATRRQQLTENPHQIKLYSQLSNLLTECGDWDEAIALSDRANLLQRWRHVSEKHYEFTWDWFSHRIPIWQEHLGHLAHQHGLQALELGCWEGRSTCWLLDHILTSHDSRIVCLDWTFQARFDLNIDRSDGRTKVTKRSGNPLTHLATLPPATYDLIHVGSDDLATLQQRLALCWQALKPNGILLVDEYCQGYLIDDSGNPENVRDGIDQHNQHFKATIDRVLILIATEAKILYQNRQILIQKSLHSVP
jgi:tetratricopeptide (TPR) repeat protein